MRMAVIISKNTNITANIKLIFYNLKNTFMDILTLITIWTLKRRKVDTEIYQKYHI